MILFLLDFLDHPEIQNIPSKQDLPNLPDLPDQLDFPDQTYQGNQANQTFQTNQMIWKLIPYQIILIQGLNSHWILR